MKLLRLGERVSRALQEEHRDPHLEEVLAAIGGGAPSRVQGKTEKGQAADLWQGRRGLRLRGHAPTEGPAARDEGKSRCQPGGLGHRGPHGGMGKARRIGPLRALLHVRELIAQARDASAGELSRDRFQERVPHACSGAVSEHEAGSSVRRTYEQAGDGTRAVDCECHGFRVC
jgi:hypothetical protein